MDKHESPRRRVPRQARSRETVARIRQAAVDILVSEGLDGLNTNAIAERAGVNISTLYGYFPDKHSIIYALFQSFETERSEAVLTATAKLSQSVSWRAWLHDTIDRMASLRTAWPAGIVLRRALALHPELQALDDRSSELTADALAQALSDRCPPLPPGKLQRIAKVSVTTITLLLDQAFATSPPDYEVIDELKALVERYLSPYLDAQSISQSH